MSIQSFPTLDTSLDLDIAITKRILTHKLSTCQVDSLGKCSATASSMVSTTSSQKIVPPFPMDHLCKVLDSLQGEEPSLKITKNVCGDTTSGVCGITELTPADDEEEKASVRLDDPIRSVGMVGFVPYSKNIESCDDNFKASIPTPCQNPCNSPKEQKYEKKNIYYKAVFRDIRRYFIEELKSTSSRLLKGKILEFLNSKIPPNEMGNDDEMVSIIAPFLNYNKYMIEFENKRISDHKCILDCLQNFTLTKMRKVLKYPAIKTLVNYYYAQTVVEGRSVRIESHKTMKKQPHKYLEVLEKISDISSKT
ncbi:unnamed protein product [Moneuplotes crassus]|uniref:Uncharacterized protein n=1 Tax=Euplotes crassus TaxID=5936 RepID=A0AAD1XLK3_EUPCR|nr:unnamed protein product [Moneuplotes crassus]